MGMFTDGQRTVEAMQATHNPGELLQWLTAGGWPSRGADRILREGGVVIMFHDGLHVVPVGDYITKSGDGFERQDAATFEAAFEPLEKEEHGS